MNQIITMTWVAKTALIWAMRLSHRFDGPEFNQVRLSCGEDTMCVQAPGQPRRAFDVDISSEVLSYNLDKADRFIRKAVYSVLVESENFISPMVGAE